jgi:hypothetical protein
MVLSDLYGPHPRTFGEFKWATTALLRSVAQTPICSEAVVDPAQLSKFGPCFRIFDQLRDRAGTPPTRPHVFPTKMRFDDRLSYEAEIHLSEGFGRETPSPESGATG